MKAVVHTKNGPPEVLKLIDIEKPFPKDNEVLIRIHATTVTAGDVLMRGMKFPMNIIFNLALGIGRNKIQGHELSGEIEAVGKTVTRFKPGNKIFASTGDKGGGYAEYICLPENGMIALKPKNLTFEEAAAVPIGANTALDILRKANIQKGQRVLVFGASGSVGTYAVQLAKYYGAEVTGVCSAANLNMVRSLGAEKVIDYMKDDFTQSGVTYDVVFDAVRKLSTSRAKKALKRNGQFLSTMSFTSEKQEDLGFLRDLIESKLLKPVIDRYYPLEEIIEAHKYVDTGHKKGNVVIRIFNPDQA